MYKFWQKRDWNCALLVPPNTHSFMKRRAAPCNHQKIYTKKGLKLCVRKGTEIVHFMVPPKYTFSYEMKGCPLATTRIIYFCKFRPKRAWKYAYLACKIIFLGKGAPPPCNHKRKHFDRKGTEIVHLWLPRNTHPFIKRTAAPCDHQKLYISGGHKGPPEIIYFCKFKPKKKRAWNYA